MAVWFKFVGFLPKFWFLRLAVRPAGSRGGAPGKLSSGCLTLSFSRARRCFPLFLGRLLCRRARYCSKWSFSGWPSFFMFAFGPAQLALGRPQDRLSAARSRVCRGLRGAAGGCMSAELGGAYFLSSRCCMLVVFRANLPFPHVFPLFSTATRKCV